MTTPSANLLVLVGKQFACIKVVGRANFNLGVHFQTLLTELHQRGYKYFVMELSECLLMDSTFLGILARFGLQIIQEDTREATPCPVELRNPNARLLELLENLGVLHLFQVTHGALAAPEVLEVCAVKINQPTREETTRACLKAHETLMEIQPANVAKFKDVARFLAEDLQKLQKKS